MNIKYILILFLVFVLALALNSCIIKQAENPINTQEESTLQSQDDEETGEVEDTGEIDNSAVDEDCQAPADELSHLIIVDSPEPGQIITSPLIIEGQARGTWFFEASFPVRLLDAEGNIIVEYYAQTEEEWMTEEFISFSSRLEFDAPDTETGTLILIKDNPSDIAEYDAQLELPVRFR